MRKEDGRKEMGIDIATLFQGIFGNLEDFEKRFTVKLPDDIKVLLS